METKGHIRWLIRMDMPHVLAIEDFCFGNKALTESDVIGMLRQTSHIGMVIEVQDVVVGFIIYQLHRNSIELMRLAVHPNHQRCGFGSQLLKKIIGKLDVNKRRRITFLVPDYLLGCHLFLKANGFRATCHGNEYHFMRGVRWNEQSLQTT